jgi:hypothetical protein
MTTVTNLTTAATASSGGCTCQACSQAALERVRYFPRQLLTVDDMVTDQNYFREKLRRHNRYLHGTGVVCGLWVTPSPTSDAPWQVAISAGYAVGPYGDEIYVDETVYLDLARCAAGDTTDPCDPTVYNAAAKGIGRRLFVAIQYAECLAKPVRSMAAGCGCADVGCEFSRIRDSFELGCTLTPPHAPPPLICALRSKNAVVPCPPDPTDPWVVLAEVLLPARSEAQLTAADIRNGVRTPLYSTSMIQTQVISCCCGPTVQPFPVQVTTVNPADGATVPPPVNQVVVTFNKPLQPGSVNTNTLQVSAATGGTPLPGKVAYDAASNTGTFYPATQLPQGVYTVTAVGAGAAPITDTDNLALDGVGDGKPGSNHVTKFTVQQHIIP